ncbi:M28 family peptidase [Massilia violaceinigra]|uniref:M28 family peptidase n=1 Tax=Massilia violaceinigra TaxID=2045208 RepID=A0ABY4ACP6_9BURK|nr:M28 family peptidase [Massilia violaceinigra]UOD32552.1 M28 family peptidase [Massilia violaceinigra]
MQSGATATPAAPMRFDRLVAGRGGIAGLAAALLLAALLAWLTLRPAMPAAPQDAGPAGFSLTRALAHRDFLAQTPRPIASDANLRARDYLLEKLRALGLDPQVQTATVTGGADRLTVAVVHNIVLRVRGSALVRRTPLMLATHYDSVADAPDAAGAVAALLESLRALRHGPPLRQDLIVLIADGEHAASLGARAFVEQHPWARHVGLLLRFDGAAGEGPLTLLGTHGANGNTVTAWAGLDAPTAGSSRAPEADTSPLRTLGLAGMRFSATLAGGEAMLSLVRAFGARPLEAIAAPQRLYFSVPLAGVLHYPEHMVWHITHLACALCLVVCWALLRRGLRIAPLMLAGALALLVVVSAARPGASYLLAWPLIGVLLGVGALYLPLAASLSRHARGAIATAGLLPAIVLLLPLAADTRTPAAAPPAPGITYLADATTWKSYWLDGATARAVSEAPRSGIAFPQVEMLKDEDSPARRKVAFALTSNNAAPTIALRVEGARVLAARLDGRALATRRFGGWTLTLHGMGERRLPIELELEGGRPARILIEESIPGLPADTVPTRRIDAPRNGRILATDTLLLR